MNLKHPYEKHLAEKLVQLPPPGDPDQNWQQMKSLLDKDLPRGGGGPGGRFRWWIAGTIVAVLVGTWFGSKQLITKEQRNEAVAGTIKTVNNKKAPAVASTEKNVEQPAAKHKNLPGAEYASTTSTPNDAAVTTTDQQADVAVTNNNGNGGSVPDNKTAKARSSGNNTSIPPSVTTNDNNRTVPDAPNNTSHHHKISPDRKNIYATDSKIDNKSTGNNYITTNNRHRKVSKKANKAMAGAGAVVLSGAATSKAKNKKGQHGVNNPPAGTNIEPGNLTYTPTIFSPRRSQPSQPDGSGLPPSPVTYKINYTEDVAISPSAMIQREFTYLFPEKTNNNKTAAHKKSLFSTNEDKQFAFGLSLPLTFPIGDQEPLAYNSNAGVNTVSDYIPSPHFQYHFNNKTYIQAGLQFRAPQFIHPLLLYQDQKMYQQGPSLVEMTTNITARKLYYFNVPITIYHSPLKNFYMGTGLQYSHLLSGVAQYEQIEKKYSPGGGPPQEYLVKNYFSKFKNDSLSSRLNSSEVRLLIDMSYYWSRFTVGLQYSQAFNNYVSIQVNPPLSPYTFDKNKSLQFYLRYNIWEDKKRRQPKGQQPLLTLK